MGAHGRVGELREPLFARQARDLLVGRVRDERVHGALEAQQQAGGALGDLGRQVAALGGVLLAGGQQPAPLVGIHRALQARERDRAARLLAELAHPGQLVALGCQVARHLEDAVSDLAEHAADAQHLLVGGVGAGHHLAVLGAVQDGARRREAEGAGLQRLAHERGHLLDVLGRGLLVLRAALAHHVGAHRAVGYLGADVDRAGHALDGVEVLREALPLPADALGQRRAGDVLDALHQLDQVVLLAGPDGREAHAAVAHHDGGDAVPARRREVRVPGDLAVVVGVDVDPARGHEQALGVDLPAALAHVAADGDDAVAVDGDVARRGAAPVPSTRVPPRITRSCMGAPIFDGVRAPAGARTG